MAQQQVRQITVKVDTRGSRELKALSDALGGVSGSVKKMQRDMGSLTGVARTLTGVFSGYLSLLSVREFTQAADSMQSLGDRLRIVTGSTEAASDTMGKLLQIANRTKLGGVSSSIMMLPIRLPRSRLIRVSALVKRISPIPSLATSTT